MSTTMVGWQRKFGVWDQLKWSNSARFHCFTLIPHPKLPILKLIFHPHNTKNIQVGSVIKNCAGIFLLTGTTNWLPTNLENISQAGEVRKYMVINAAVQSRSTVFYFILSAVLWEVNAYLFDLFHLVVQKSGIQCFKHLLWISWE